MALQRTAERPAQSLLTWEEYLRLPEMRQRYEIIDGKMIMCPSPTDEHQWMLSELNDRVKSFVREHKLGVVLFAPLDIVIRREPRLQTRQPDLLFFSAARIGGTGMAALRQARQEDLPPDLAVELLSPEEHRRNLTDKLEDYAAIGVREVWIVSPEAETVEVLALAEGQYSRAGLYGHGDTVASTVLAGFELAVDATFE